LNVCHSKTKVSFRRAFINLWQKINSIVFNWLVCVIIQTPLSLTNRGKLRTLIIESFSYILQFLFTGIFGGAYGCFHIKTTALELLFFLELRSISWVWWPYLLIVLFNFFTCLSNHLAFLGRNLLFLFLTCFIINQISLIYFRSEKSALTIFDWFGIRLG